MSMLNDILRVSKDKIAAQATEYTTIIQGNLEAQFLANLKKNLHNEPGYYLWEVWEELWVVRTDQPQPAGTGFYDADWYYLTTGHVSTKELSDKKEHSFISNRWHQLTGRPQEQNWEHTHYVFYSNWQILLEPLHRNLDTGKLNKIPNTYVLREMPFLVHIYTTTNKQNAFNISYYPNIKFIQAKYNRACPGPITIPNQTLYLSDGLSRASTDNLHTVKQPTHVVFHAGDHKSNRSCRRAGLATIIPVIERANNNNNPIHSSSSSSISSEPLQYPGDKSYYISNHNSSQSNWSDSFFSDSSSNQTSPQSTPPQSPKNSRRTSEPMPQLPKRKKSPDIDYALSPAFITGQPQSNNNNNGINTSSSHENTDWFDKHFVDKSNNNKSPPQSTSHKPPKNSRRTSEPMPSLSKHNKSADIDYALSPPFVTGQPQSNNNNNGINASSESQLANELSLKKYLNSYQAYLLEPEEKMAIAARVISKVKNLHDQGNSQNNINLDNILIDPDSKQVQLEDCNIVSTYYSYFTEEEKKQNDIDALDKVINSILRAGDSSSTPINIVFEELRSLPSRGILVTADSLLLSIGGSLISYMGVSDNYTAPRITQNSIVVRPKREHIMYDKKIINDWRGCSLDGLINPRNQEYEKFKDANYYVWQQPRLITRIKFVIGILVCLKQKNQDFPHISLGNTFVSTNNKKMTVTVEKPDHTQKIQVSEHYDYMKLLSNICMRIIWGYYFSTADNQWNNLDDLDNLRDYFNYTENEKKILYAILHPKLRSIYLKNEYAMVDLDTLISIFNRTLLALQATVIKDQFNGFAQSFNNIIPQNQYTKEQLDNTISNMKQILLGQGIVI